nr:VOC family protein [Hymenobacter nivis]
MKTNRLQHVGLPITDLEASQAFYEKLGFHRATNATFDHAGAPGQVSVMQRGDIILEGY